MIEEKPAMSSKYRLGRGRGALGLALVGLLAACGSAPDGAIRFGLPTAPVTLDPRYATDAESSRINRLLYRSLVTFDENLKPVPDLATWEQIGPLRYRFTLGSEGRAFHNGERLEAGDVAATLRFILAPDNGSPHRAGLNHLQAVEVLDPDTLSFRLEHPDALFPGRLTLGILPASAIERAHPFNRRPLGSGEFELLDWPEAGRLRLRRRADGQLIEFLEVKDPVVRVLKLLRGELDLVQGNLPPELVAWLADRGEIKLRRERGGNFTYLGFNLQDPLTGRLEIRQAIAHAVDREAIIRYLMGDSARPALSLLPPDHWAGNPGLEGYAHDPERARALLAGAGFGPENPPRLSYKTSSNPFRVRLATLLSYQLEQVGFEVSLRGYDWGTFYSDIKAGHFQVFSLSWVGIKMPDIFRYVFHSESVPPAGANRGRFHDPISDRLIEAAEKTENLDEQAELYRTLQVRLLERLPYVPLWYEDQVLATRPDIAGYQLAADGNYDSLETVYRLETAESRQP